MKKNTRRNVLLSLALTGVMLGACGAATLNSREAKADTPLNKGTIDVYLIGGQSNSVGYGFDTNGTLAAQDSRYVYGFDNVLYYGAQERWDGADLTEGFQEVKIGCGVNYDRAGAEIGIASVLGDTDTMNAVIKCAWGATHLYPDSLYSISLSQGTWTSPSYLEEYNIDTSVNPKIGRMYNWFLQTVTDGLAQLVADGYTPVIKGMWWMQGEAEMFDPVIMSEQYDELLRALISDIREDVSAISGYDCSEMPFVFGLPSWNEQRNPNLPPYQDDVRANMRSVASDITLTNVACVDCVGLVQHDDWHFDAASQRRLGIKFMEALSELNEGEKASFKEDISAFAMPQVRVDEPVGLRFGAKIGYYDAANKYKYGMLIVPTDYLTTYADGITAANYDYIKAFGDLNVDIVNLPCGVSTGDWNGDGVIENYIQGSLVGVKYANLSRAFTGIGYIYDQKADKYLYTSAYNANTAGYVANAELSRYEETNPAYATLQNFINGAINHKNGVDEANGYNPATITLNTPAEIKLTYGDIATPVNINATQSPNMGFPMVYTSANPSVAIVDENGNVSAVGVGETTVSVSCFGQTKQIAIKVENTVIDGITLDCTRDAKYGDFSDTVTLNDGKYYNVSAVKTANGVFVYTEGLFNTSTVATTSWAYGTGVEFKLNGNSIQSAVAVGKHYAGVTQFVTNVEKQANGKYLHTFEFFVDKSMIPNWTDNGTVQLNYAWKTPNENSAIVDDMIDYQYMSAWGNNSNWMSWHRLGGLSTGFNGLVDNLQVGKNGLEVAGVPANSGITVDGVANETAYGANELNVTAGATTNVKATVVDGDLYLAMTISYAKKSTYFTAGDWWKNNNFEFYVNGQHFAVMLIDGKLSIPACVTAGAETTTTDGSTFTTVIELYMQGDCDVYDVRMNANGDGFGWNDLAWNNGNAKYVTADGFVSGSTVAIDGLTLDGDFNESAYTAAVQNSAVTATANGATVKIMGVKQAKGVLFGITITHTKAANVPTTGSGFYQYLNPELRFANGVGYFHTTMNKHENTGLYAYAKTVDNGDGTYTSYFEYYVRYETIGVSASANVDFRVGGWYETGWAWLFGTDGTRATHTVTANGIVAK